MDYIDRTAVKFFKDIGWPLWLVCIMAGGLLATALGCFVVPIIDLIFGVESHWIHYLGWGTLILLGLWKLIKR